MRAALFAILFAAAACTPDIVPGSYLCGPDQACPEGQVCNGTENKMTGLVADTCMLPEVAQPFACTPATASEPDDTMDTGQLITPPAACIGKVDLGQGCMASGDAADWVTFVAPSVCTALMVEARLDFPLANEGLTIELWDADANMKMTGDGDCKQGLDASSVSRCLDSVLVPGKKYGVQVKPTGDGNCGGDCSYNRYKVTLLFGTPG